MGFLDETLDLQGAAELFLRWEARGWLHRNEAIAMFWWIVDRYHLNHEDFFITCVIERERRAGRPVADLVADLERRKG